MICDDEKGEVSADIDNLDKILITPQKNGLINDLNDLDLNKHNSSEGKANISIAGELRDSKLSHSKTAIKFKTQ